MAYNLHTQMKTMIKKNTVGTSIMFCYDVKEEK